ncbi:MAG: hypothetical protein NVSMB9_29430 [Isosphaeraceae bacterium]
MPPFLRMVWRILFAGILLLIGAGCVYQAVAAREAPRDEWWIYWTIDAAIGLPCLLAAGWLIWPGRGRY